MRQFLVVGCGGSGAETLAYMMDQLRSELAEVGIDSLPGAWQFVSIDVPTAPDSVAKGLIRDVRAQGGRYVACAPLTDSYEILDSSVVDTLRRTGGLGEIATWSHRDPQSESTAIQAGAGQYRGLGRMITLNSVTAISKALREAWITMKKPESEAELTEVASRVPGSGGFKKDSSPVVLVVASMAGGSGASMALDVCRLISDIDGAEANQIGLFAVAPNIFDGLEPTARLGVRANGLAMFGEIVAAQSGAAHEHDVTLLKAAGLDIGVSAPLPFARMFPVGRFVGTGKLFGDGSKGEIYRALARGLSAMMVSDRATQQFVSYDLGNKAGLEVRSTELGWGFPNWNDFPWGSYGFASLSMGRDRYVEYAAQRIAREAVDHLVNGHVSRSSTASSVEQLKSKMDSQWPTELRHLGMPAPIDNQYPSQEQWLTQTALGEQMIEGIVSSIIDDDIAKLLPREEPRQKAQDWLAVLEGSSSSPAVREAVEKSARDAAYLWAFEWQRALESSLLDRIESGIGRFGLPFATDLAVRYKDFVEQSVLPALASMSQWQTGSAADLPEASRQKLRGLGKAKLSGTGEEHRAILQDYRYPVRNLVLARAAGYAVEVLSDFVGGVLNPLVSSLSDKLALLEKEQRRDPSSVDVGMARIATPHYVAWPDRGADVPKRFEVAGNEVLMTSVSEYPVLFEGHLPRAADPGDTALRFEDSIPKAVDQVVRGQWVTTGGDRAPGGLIETRSVWRAARMNIDPSTAAPVTPSTGSFDIHVRPIELVERARKFVSRPGESFRDFADVSLSSFVTEHGGSEVEMEDRKNKLESMFVRALEASLPLSSVNNTIVSRLYGKGLVYRYKFSEIPFERSADVQELLRSKLTGNQSIDQVAVENFDEAMSDSEKVRRIDIFGSYPNYSPLAYTMVLNDANEDWSQAQGRAKEAYWSLRRARTLPASLPMSKAERRAMVAGWFVGLITGRIFLPQPPYSDPVHIYAGEEGQWLAFPNPLLTPPAKFYSPSDWLPAILESFLLALAQAQGSHLKSVAPYTELRSLYDDDPVGPTKLEGGMTQLAAQRHLADWINGRSEWFGSAVSAVNQSTDPTTKTNAAIAYLGSVNRQVEAEYVPARTTQPGQQHQAKGSFSLIADRRTASRTPFVRDLAEDIMWATTQLAELLRRAHASSHQTQGLF